MLATLANYELNQLFLKVRPIDKHPLTTPLENQELEEKDEKQVVQEKDTIYTILEKSAEEEKNIGQPVLKP